MSLPTIPETTSGALDSWQRFPTAAAWLATIVGTLWGFFSSLAAGLGLAWWLLILRDWSWLHALAVIIALVAVIALFGGWLGYLRWRSAAWRLDAIGLQVKRGRFWRQEILIPRSRVQHLDLERGPIERQCGLATLIVHTAGSSMDALRQPGFADADAVALRDALVPASNDNDDVL